MLDEARPVETPVPFPRPHLAEVSQMTASTTFHHLITATLGLTVLLAPPALAAPQHPLECVSVASTGAPANGPTFYPSISADGRYVAFTSDARNLVPGDTNRVPDVFRKDRLTGEVVRVSVGAGGAQADDESYTSYLTAISADGRFVCFTSDATNLVPGDTNDREDVFVRDLVAGTTTRVSVGPGGIEADGDSDRASISADGNRVVFESQATNLLAQSATPAQIYVHDTAAGLTRIASVDSSGNHGDGGSSYPAISGDGNVVAFLSHAHNLGLGISPSVITYDFYLHDLGTGETRTGVASPAVLGGLAGALYASLDFDGSRVAFWCDDPELVPGDTNGVGDAYVLDVPTGEIRRVSVSSIGAEGDAQLDFPKISADGRFVSFESRAGTLVPGDTNASYDAFVHDLETGATTRASVAADGSQGTLPANGLAGAIARGFSADGRYVVFSGSYEGLVPSDSNGVNDAFVQDRGALAPGAYCEAKTDSVGCVPAMGFTGIPSATSASAFDVRAERLPAGRLGVLLYGFGSSHEPFAGGVRCVAPPIRRAAVVTSVGSGSGCTASLSADFNARIRSGADTGLVPGTVVYAQYLYRDRGDPSGANLGMSDALRFVVQP
jgi:Tol biopolymer transport system component